MTETKSNQIKNLEQNFRKLIIERCKFCDFDKYLDENPDFEFPKIDESLLGWENGQHITIPGMFGGFDYFLGKVGNHLVLYAEQSSRMDHDSNSSSVFEVSLDGSRLLEGEERRMVWEQFRQLDKKRFEEHKRKAKERREHEPSQRK